MIDKNNLQLKYITGQYLNLNTIEPNDILFFMMSKNKKSMSIEDVKKTVANTEYKMKEFDGCLKLLVERGEASIDDEKITIIDKN